MAENQIKNTTNDKTGKESVFSNSDNKIDETPEWLKQAGDKSEGKIIAPESGDPDQFSEVLPSLRSEKPSQAELGQDPSSMIEVTPSLEVVEKADFEASEKLESAGYDPKTGKTILAN